MSPAESGTGPDAEAMGAWGAAKCLQRSESRWALADKGTRASGFRDRLALKA